MVNNCDPNDYIRREDHEQHCLDRIEWAKQVIKASEDDRKEIKERITLLEKFKDKATWASLVLAVGIIATNILGPQLARNGDGQRIKDLVGYVAVMSQAIAEQKDQIEQGNKTSLENQAKLEKLEKKMREK